MCACAQTKELFRAQRPELKHAIKLTQPRCSKRTPSTKTIHAAKGAETECTSHRRRRVFRRPLQRALPGHELPDTPSPHPAHQKRRRQRRDSVRERSSVLVLCVCRVCSDCSHSGQRYIGSCVLLGLQTISSFPGKVTITPRSSLAGCSAKEAERQYPTNAIAQGSARQCATLWHTTLYATRASMQRMAYVCSNPYTRGPRCNSYFSSKYYRGPLTRKKYFFAPVCNAMTCNATCNARQYATPWHTHVVIRTRRTWVYRYFS
jgi:hypothetical protein